MGNVDVSDIDDFLEAKPTEGESVYGGPEGVDLLYSHACPGHADRMKEHARRVREHLRRRGMLF